jgi:hypothetical protein
MAKRMAKQMELFEPVERGFDEGGLMEEGGMVDEVSGNDVPPGSLRTEVRDDIPAQLSEGEFVFPADVVRYIGLENLMRMRQEAKQGLAQMEAMGQMGNSEEATIEDNLPFDMYDLDVDDEDEYNNMAVGGMPTKDQTRQAFQLGGTVQLPGFTGVQTTQPTAPTTGYRPYVEPVQAASSQFIPQFTGVQYTTATGTTNIPTFAETVGRNPGQYDELRTYVNDAGQILRIPFKNGQPIYPIPYGYKYQAEEAVTPTDTTTVPTTVAGQDDSGGDGSDAISGRVATTLGTNPAIGVSVPTGGAVSQADKDAFGGNVGAYKNTDYRSAVIDLAGYQLGSLSPTAALANQMGKNFGLTQSGNFNEIGTAMNQARNEALSALGLANMGQVTTDAQYSAIADSMIAAKEAAKKGNFAYATVTRDALAKHQDAIKAGQVAAMTELGYKSTDINNPVAVARAMASYDTQIGQLSGEIDAATQSGAVTSAVTNEPVRDKDQNPVMTEKGLAKVNNLKEILSAKKAKKDSLLSTEVGKAAAVSAAFDAAGYNEDDDPGQNAPAGGYTGNVSEDPGFDSGFSDGSQGSESGGGYGSDSGGVGGAGDMGVICLTEDMKVKCNGIVDFVTRVQVGDIIDNTVVTEVLHKHMREGYYKVNGELKITNDHPVLVNGSWKRTEDLVLGDYINNVEVTSLEYVEQVTPTVYIGTADDRYDVYTEGEVYTVHGQYKNALKKAA